MDIGLCMIVKDEVGRLTDCLDPIVDLLGDIVIVDTGSTDGTRELLAERYGIAALRGALDAGNCNSKAPARNQAHAALRTPWILSLDADERIDRAALETLRSMPDDARLGGYFLPWHTVRGTQVVEDYKLCVYRRTSPHRARARADRPVRSRARSRC